MSELLNLNASVPGRQCPLAYRYGPEALALAPTQTCDTLYVIGGLYGNPYALEAILTLAKQLMLLVELLSSVDKIPNKISRLS